MKQKLYEYDLPRQLIAQTPARPRDSARLLVYRLSDGVITDSIFSELGSFLPDNSTIAINNSKVENCRWLFDDGRIEIFVLERLDTQTIRALIRPGRKFKLNKLVKLTDWLTAETVGIDEEGIRTLKLNVQHDDPRLAEYEHVPLPPYINQDDNLACEYQTVYAKPPGSLAAPTAGLHFTDMLMKKLAAKHKFAEVTLHVGLGTFAQLSEDNFRTGTLHSEQYFLKDSDAAILNDSSHLTGVGTTTIRALESVLKKAEKYIPGTGYTDIFIRPRYEFKSVDAFVTNFHLPGTSLLMLVAAFIADKKGLREVEAAAELMRIYNHAISRKYRFYSFGDAMLII